MPEPRMSIVLRKARVKQALREKSGLDGRCGIYLGRGLADDGGGDGGETRDRQLSHHAFRKRKCVAGARLYIRSKATRELPVSPFTVVLLSAHRQAHSPAPQSPKFNMVSSLYETMSSRC